jgi:hypothetical protein
LYNKKAKKRAHLKKDMKKTIIVILIVLALAAIIAAIFVFGRPFGAKSVNQITNVESGKLPDYFPSIPIDAGALVVNNYNAVSPSGRMQATRAIKSPASVLANFIFYKNYLTDKNNGWTFLSEVNGTSPSGHKALLAKNGTGTLNINISASTGGSIVDISFLALKPAK